jgi:hypothetical protein
MLMAKGDRGAVGASSICIIPDRVDGQISQLKEFNLTF